MLYSPDVLNCTMPYVPRTVLAYAVRDPAYTAEVFALALVEMDVVYSFFIIGKIQVKLAINKQTGKCRSFPPVAQCKQTTDYNT